MRGSPSKLHINANSWDNLGDDFPDRTGCGRHGAAIGGLKVASQNGWFAARPSGTENIYKIYAESFKGEAHLDRVIDEARAMVTAVLQG